MTSASLWLIQHTKRTKLHVYAPNIEEGRAASKSPHKKFGYFLSISQQGVSADIIQNFRGCVFGPHSKKACVHRVQRF
jgi:hypothetical protein